MKKIFTFFLLLCITTLSFANGGGPVVNTTHAGSGPYTTIQAAIDNAATVNNDIITVNGSTYTAHETINVHKGVTIEGVSVWATITPATSGVGINVTANGVTLEYLIVSGTTGSINNHGIWANGVSGLTIQSVHAQNNAGSGIALRNVSTTSLTNIMAIGNASHGLEIGNGSTGVQVNGGTFYGNGTAGVLTTGGGIMIYADAGQSTNTTSIIGDVTADNNTTAGIYLYCNATGHINYTTIGDASGTVSASDNGSTSGSYGTGGAAVLLFGPCDHTTIKANSTNTGAVNPTAGLVVLGTDASGSNSPTNTVAVGCNLSGFSATSPAATMKAIATDGTTLRCKNDVTASGTPYNTINSIGTGAITLPADGYTVENLLVHKVDDILCGRFLAPGGTIYVTQASGLINNGIASAGGAYTTVQVQAGTYHENVIVNKSITLSGDGPTTVINPFSGIGINVTANGVTISALEVSEAPNHGIWADGVNNLNIHNVTVEYNGSANGESTVGSGIALRGITGTSAITNVTATHNANDGLEIGTGCNGVTVSGGTFSNNGVAGYASTGGGIFIYANTGGTTQNTVIKGTLTASNNTTAGIYICSTPGSVTGTSIGQNSGDNITLSENGSTGHDGTGGAGVLIYGGATSTTISALFTRSSVVGSGLVVLGTDNLGTSSPSGTVVQNSTFTGYNSGTSPAITLASETFSGSWTTNAKICTTNVTATTAVTFTGATTSAAIDALIYDKLDMSTLGLVSYTSPSILVKVKVFLQGPYSGSAMTTALNTGTLIPLSSSTAYNTTTYGYTNKTVTAIPNANVVDWVLVELRTGTAATSKVETQAAFLLSNGSIVDIDGSSDVAFSTAAAGNYYIVVRHRNHLAVMSVGIVALPNGTVFDFTASGQAYGSTTPTVAVATGVYAMWCGDTDASGKVDVTDRTNTWNDRNNLGYLDDDTDLSGKVDVTDRTNTWNNRNVLTQVP
jgi:hypothetical protein